MKTVHATLAVVAGLILSACGGGGGGVVDQGRLGHKAFQFTWLPKRRALRVLKFGTTLLSLRAAGLGAGELTAKDLKGGRILAFSGSRSRLWDRFSYGDIFGVFRAVVIVPVRTQSFPRRVEAV